MKTPRYTIRDATSADAEAVTRMHVRSWIDTYPNVTAGVSQEWTKARTDAWLTPENFEKRRERIEEALHSDDFLFLVAEDDEGEIIALASPFRNESIQRVGAIYVAKEYHGSGLAQELMNKVIDWADPHRPLELNVATYNERAKAFYRKYGFKEVENSEQKVHGIIPAVSMIRKGDKQ